MSLISPIDIIHVFSVILLDLDDFKRVNDTLGHLIGDEVLVKLAKILKTNIRDSDTVGRWGGEEFLVILPKADENEAAIVADKLRKTIEEADFGIGSTITASMGVGSSDGDLNLTVLLSYADKALYKAKKDGKNTVVKVSEIIG